MTNFKYLQLTTCFDYFNINLKLLGNLKLNALWNNFNSPKTKLSGLKICPKGPERTESIVPGSKSTKTALGTYLPPAIGKKKDNQRWQFDKRWQFATK